jgi:hypothetical protein
MLGLGLMACSGAAAREPDADRWQLGNRALDRTLVVGTLIEATIHGSGEALTATVSTDVRNASGWVVIPAGCPVGLRIAGRGLLDVTSVTVWGQVYPVSATVEVTRVAVVPPGTRILFVLPEGLTVERRFKDASLQIASSFDARQIRAPDHNC